MRKILLVIVMLVMSVKFYAQYTSINLDIPTIGATGAALAANLELERQSNNMQDSIEKHYLNTSLSVAGIYYSKRLDRKAMTDAGLFSSKEFGYYQRIYSLTSDYIMPEILSVSSKLIKYPQNVMYWGPYLYKTTTDVEQLCKEYQMVCANGKVDFGDIKFLMINQGLTKLFDLAHLGDLDWRTILEKVADFDPKQTVENIKHKFSNIPTMIAEAGKEILQRAKGKYGEMSEDVSEIEKIGNVFHASPQEILVMVDKYRGIINQYKDGFNLKDQLMSIIKTTNVDALERLFYIDKYDVSDFITETIAEKQGDYYRQRYYIYTEDKGSKTLCTYTPTVHESRDDNWDEWSHFVSEKDKMVHHSLTASELADLKQRSERFAGWNQAKVDEYNKANPGHNAIISYNLVHEDRDESYKHGWGKRHHKLHCFYAYSITVTDNWDIKNVVYENTYDSKKMNLHIFEEDMNQQLNMLNDQQDEDLYKLGKDPKVYYQDASEEDVQKAGSVAYYALCADARPVLEGGFNWKENSKKQGSSLSEDSKQFAMGPSPAESGDLTTLKSRQASAKAKVSDLQAKKKATEAARNVNLDLQRQATQALDKAKLEKLRSEYDKLTSQYNNYDLELSVADKELAEIDNALNEYYDDLADDGGTYRINKNMAEIAGNFKVQWKDDGLWDDTSDSYTFTRKGYSETLKLDIKYVAELTLKKKPQYFLGIRIHRAVLAVSYKLTTSGDSKDCIDNLYFEKGETAEQKAQRANDRLKELMEDFKDCSITMKFQETTDSIDKDSTDITNVHLLWSSDRIEVARRIENKLTEIYADLLSIDRYLDSRLTIADFLKNAILNYVNRKERFTIAQQALGRWEGKAKNVSKNMILTNVGMKPKKEDKQEKENKTTP